MFFFEGRTRNVVLFYLLHFVPAVPLVFWAFRDRGVLVRLYFLFVASYCGPFLTFVILAALKELLSRREARRLAVVRDVMES